MLGCKPSNTPMESTYKVGLMTNSPPIDKGRYQCLVGKLIYLSHTRLDISLSMSVVSQYMNNLNKDFEAEYKILQYLKMTLGKGLFFQKGSNRGIAVYSNED